MDQGRKSVTGQAARPDSVCKNRPKGLVACLSPFQGKEIEGMALRIGDGIPRPADYCSRISRCARVPVRLRMQPERYRPVIDQPNLHMGTEAAGCNPRVRSAGEFHQPAEPASAIRGRGSRGETGPHSLAGVGGQRELWDQQQPAASVGKGQIHLALGVGKNPVTEQPLAHPLRLRFAIAGFDRDQHQQAGIDGADRFVVDGDRCGGDALEEGDHGVGFGIRDWDSTSVTMIVMPAKAGIHMFPFHL